MQKRQKLFNWNKVHRRTKGLAYIFKMQCTKDEYNTILVLVISNHCQYNAQMHSKVLKYNDDDHHHHRHSHEMPE